MSKFQERFFSKPALGVTHYLHQSDWCGQSPHLSSLFDLKTQECRISNTERLSCCSNFVNVGQIPKS